MFEQGIRGVVSMISKRYAKVNNKYMGEKLDPNEKSKFIQYLNANNLYGWVMSWLLPVSGFRWMDENDLENWIEFSDGCILEIDLEYPKKLHDSHNAYLLVLHYKNLKQYLNLGLKLKKIPRRITFNENAWLKPYIELNTNLRFKAQNEFEKDFFKLMSNSIFGKTMENIQNRVNIRLVNNQMLLKKCAAKPNFDHCTKFDENLVAVHMKKTELVFNKQN